MSWFLSYLALGAVAGFFAGLLGIGGGAMMVPLLAMLFSAQAFPENEILHLALGTTMAAILFTSISSMRAHHAYGAVRWPIVLTMTPGILLGTSLGAWLASRVSSWKLGLFFTLFIFYTATQMIADRKPKSRREMPGIFGTMMVGGGIGVFSCLVGIGGGTLSVPFLIWCNIPALHAIGTSAAIGFPVALGSALGYALNGWSIAQLPPFSLGFVYLPAVLGIMLSSMLTAPLGARLTHRLPAKRIKQIFAIVLILLALKMLFGLIRT